MGTFRARISSFLASFIGSVVLLIVVAALPQGAFAVSGLPDGYDIEYLTGGLSRPTAMAFAPDGRIFIAEKSGTVRVSSSSFDISSTPFVTMTDVNDYGDRGLIGIALDPDFASNHYVYLAYTYENNPSDYEGEKTARVVRYTEKDGVAISGSKKVILGTVGGNASTPSCADYADSADCIASDSSSHTIGGLRFGPDKKLYVSTGDGARFDISDEHAFRAQDKGHLSGKILRINTDGTGVSDNPFYTGPDDNASKVWAYGFRNPYRFNFDPESNMLLVADVGWGEKEEVDLVTAGKNYGWPCREASLTTSGYANFPGCPITTAIEGPIYEYDHVSIGNQKVGVITGGAFATSNTYPTDFRGSYVFADAAFGWLRNITFNGQSVDAVKDFADDVPFPVEFVTGPDGLIYLLTHYSGEIRRIIHDSELPSAVFSTNVSSGIAPLSVSFDAGTSSAPGGATLTYRWSFGDGNTANEIRPTHVYSEPGEYTAELTVRTTEGLEGQSTQKIEVFAESQNNAQPFHIASSLSEAPYYFGSPVRVTSRIGNSAGTDSITPVYEIYDAAGNHLTEYDETFTEGQITPGQERAISHEFLLPVGTYEVVLVLRSPDNAVIFERTRDIANVSVTTRVPDEDSSCPPESDIDGDGWGWDGQKGCRVGGEVEDDGFGISENCPPESDPDGDGWGWDGQKGCRVGVEPEVGSICGNDTVEVGEQCDDGNLVNGDGCSNLCTFEESQEEPICGNNITEIGEQCDDGNLTNGDGCSVSCKVEEVETGDGSVMPLSVTVKPDSVKVGETATITVEMINTGQADTILIDSEVYDSKGNQVGEKYWNNQNFAAGETKKYEYEWVVTSNDVFEVAVATFVPGWGGLIQWYGAAGVITIDESDKNPTTVDDEPAGEGETIVSGTLSSQWSNWSWNTSNSTTQKTGSSGVATNMIELEYNAKHSGLYYHANQPVQVDASDEIILTMRADESNVNNDLTISLYGAGNAKIAEYKLSDFATLKSQWQTITIPVGAFSGSGFALSGIVLKDGGSSTGETFFMEELKIAR